MGVRRRRLDRSGRGALPSPGRPSVARREDHRRFWTAIAAGRSSEEAAVGVGVAPVLGPRWFRQAGGMPPSHLSPSSRPLSGRYLLFADREEIALGRAQGHGVREIARRLGRAPSTISRELRRHALRRPGVSSHNRAVARRSFRPASEAGEAHAPRSPPAVCAGAAGRPRRGAERDGGSRARRDVEGSPPRAPAGPALGDGLEPGTDRSALAGRLSRRRDDAHQPRGD